MMKRLIGCVIVIGALINACAAYPWEIGADNKVGFATYGEKYGNYENDWLGFYYEGIVSAGHYPKEGFIGGVDFGMPLTASAGENWHLSGTKNSSNDMKFWGMENNIELGYVMPLYVDQMSFAPVLVYGWNFTRFERSSFDVPGIVLQSETGTLDVWAHHVDGGFRATFSTKNEDLRVTCRAVLGYIFYASAYNDAIDLKIKADQGRFSFLVKADVKVEYDISENVTVFCGVFTNVQHIEGSSSGTVVWGENDLDSFGGSVGLKYVF